MADEESQWCRLDQNGSFRHEGLARKGYRYGAGQTCQIRKAMYAFQERDSQIGRVRHAESVQYGCVWFSRMEYAHKAGQKLQNNYNFEGFWIVLNGADRLWSFRAYTMLLRLHGRCRPVDMLFFKECLFSVPFLTKVLLGCEGEDSSLFPKVLMYNSCGEKQVTDPV